MLTVRVIASHIRLTGKGPENNSGQEWSGSDDVKRKPIGSLSLPLRVPEAAGLQSELNTSNSYI